MQCLVEQRPPPKLGLVFDAEPLFVVGRLVQRGAGARAWFALPAEHRRLRGHAPDGASTLVGVWRARMMSAQFGASSVELILQSNETSSQQTLHDAGSLLTTVGNYRVMAPENVLRLDITDWKPKQFCGPIGCSPIGPFEGETRRFEMPNAITLVTRHMLCPDNPECVIRYTRAV